MNLIEQLKTWLRERSVRARLRVPPLQAARAAPNVPAPSPLEAAGERMGEKLRLAQDYADQSARADIESFCRSEPMGRLTWYDISPPSNFGPEYEPLIGKAVRYLDLRGHLIRHPMQRQLVRFDA